MATFAAVRTYFKPTPAVVWSFGTSRTRAENARGGWRPAMFTALTSAGASPNFIGNILNSTDGVTTAGTGHDGLNGSFGVSWYGNDGTDGYYASRRPGLLSSPTMVIAEIGTNDANSAAAATSFCRVADLVAASDPQAQVLWTTPVKQAGTTQYDTQAAQIRLEVAARRTAGQNITLVDCHASVPLQGVDFIDGLHPTESGNAKIASFMVPYVLRACGL